MADRKGWDLTSTHSLESWVEWMRKQSDTLIVVVIRPHDGALAADPELDPIDVHDRIWDGDMQKLLAGLRKSRDEKRGVMLRKEAKANGR